MYMLDTSFIIELFRKPEKVSGWLKRIDEEGGATTAISYFEVFRKQHRMNRSEKLTLTRFFNSYQPLPFDLESAEETCNLWIRLEKAGETVNLLDAMIAGIMISKGVDKILTRDEDFKKIEKFTDIQALIIP
jgi:predicted nucleic acid-binding protein